MIRENSFWLEEVKGNIILHVTNGKVDFYNVYLLFLSLLIYYIKVLSLKIALLIFRSDSAFLHGATSALSGRSANGGVFSNNLHRGSSLLNRHLLIEAFEGVIAFELLKFNGSVLVKELINRQVATTNSDVNLVGVDTDGNTLGTELIDSIALTHEHDLKLLSVREVVDVLSETLINLISFNRDVDSNARLQVNDVLLQGLNLHHGSF